MGEECTGKRVHKDDMYVWEREGSMIKRHER